MTSRFACLAFALAALGLSGCNGPAPETAQATPAPVADPCTSGGPAKSSQLPPNIGTGQLQVDCDAWQMFIALNWRADPNSPGHPDPGAQWATFGTAGDTSATVWESYLEASAVFGGGSLEGLWQRKRPATLSLARTSKFGDLDLSSIVQAGSGSHWLTNQRGEVTYYEILINQDEYEFITQDGFDLTTAAGQLSCATQTGKPVTDGPPDPDAPKRGGFNMPAGNMVNGWDDTDCKGDVAKFGQGVGAIEIKAAWTPLPPDHSLDYRYKTANAEIVDPVTKKTRTVTVGLVGLHIIRKVPGHLPWVWATFEQIDNSPDEAASGGFAAPDLPANPNRKESPGYTFFNPGCVPANDPTYGCRHNVPPRPCGKGGICDPYDAPMQITRINPVGSTANGVTAYAWSLMPTGSVFNYYRLIDVQWPQTNPSPIPGPKTRVPLTQGDPMPKGAAGGPSQIVANTTLETFQQTRASCLDCHANFASIASSGLLQATAPGALRQVRQAPAGDQPYSSDYSFIFLAETRR